jgi:hypothetical protein
MRSVEFSRLKLTSSCSGVGPSGRNSIPNVHAISLFSTQKHGHNETRSLSYLASKICIRMTMKIITSHGNTGKRITFVLRIELRIQIFNARVSCGIKLSI